MVVLIIGVLASIALPQYQKAVEKARAVQLLAALKPLAEANERYYLENGQYTTRFALLDVTFPVTPVMAESTTLKDGTVIKLSVRNEAYGYTKHVLISIYYKHGVGQPHTTHTPGMMICAASQSDSIGNSICKSLSGGKVQMPGYQCALSSGCTSYLLHE